MAPAAHAQDLQRCAGITDATARLACYDALAGQAATPAAPTTPATPAAQNFGLPPPAPAEETSITAHLSSPLEELNKGLLIALDNGQAWQCTESAGAYSGTIRAGTEVTVSKGFFGGYRMSFKHGPAPLKVKRVQ